MSNAICRSVVAGSTTMRDDRGSIPCQNYVFNSRKKHALPSSGIDRNSDCLLQEHWKLKKNSIFDRIIATIALFCLCFGHNSWHSRTLFFALLSLQFYFFKTHSLRKRYLTKFQFILEWTSQPNMFRILSSHWNVVSFFKSNFVRMVQWILQRRIQKHWKVIIKAILL